jgi:benzoate membrane transport protein
MRLSIPSQALVAAVVGFSSTLALIIAAAAAVGASQAQTASMVTALCLAMAVESLWLSWRTRMPVITAWSTPGAALVAASTGFTIEEAVGAFLLVGLMLVATGLFRPVPAADPIHFPHPGLRRLGNAGGNRRHLRDQRRAVRRD